MGSGDTDNGSDIGDTLLEVVLAAGRTRSQSQTALIEGSFRQEPPTLSPVTPSPTEEIANISWKPSTEAISALSLSIPSAGPTPTSRRKSFLHVDHYLEPTTDDRDFFEVNFKSSEDVRKLQTLAYNQENLDLMPDCVLRPGNPRIIDQMGQDSDCGLLANGAATKPMSFHGKTAVLPTVEGLAVWTSQVSKVANNVIAKCANLAKSIQDSFNETNAATTFGILEKFRQSEQNKNPPTDFSSINLDELKQQLDAFLKQESSDQITYPQNSEIAENFQKYCVACKIYKENLESNRSQRNQEGIIYCPAYATMGFISNLTKRYDDDEEVTIRNRGQHSFESGDEEQIQESYKIFDNVCAPVTKAEEDDQLTMTGKEHIVITCHDSRSGAEVKCNTLLRRIKEPSNFDNDIETQIAWDEYKKYVREKNIYPLGINSEKEALIGIPIYKLYLVIPNEYCLPIFREDIQIPEEHTPQGDFIIPIILPFMAQEPCLKGSLAIRPRPVTADYDGFDDMPKITDVFANPDRHIPRISTSTRHSTFRNTHGIISKSEREKMDRANAAFNKKGWANVFHHGSENNNITFPQPIDESTQLVVKVAGKIYIINRGTAIAKFYEKNLSDHMFLPNFAWYTFAEDQRKSSTADQDNVPHLLVKYAENQAKRLFYSCQNLKEKQKLEHFYLNRAAVHYKALLACKHGRREEFMQNIVEYSKFIKSQIIPDQSPSDEEIKRELLRRARNFTISDNRFFEALRWLQQHWPKVIFVLAAVALGYGFLAPFIKIFCFSWLVHISYVLSAWTIANWINAIIVSFVSATLFTLTFFTDSLKWMSNYLTLQLPNSLKKPSDTTFAAPQKTSTQNIQNRLSTEETLSPANHSENKSASSKLNSKPVGPHSDSTLSLTIPTTP